MIALFFLGICVLAIMATIGAAISGDYSPEDFETHGRERLGIDTYPRSKGPRL